MSSASLGRGRTIPKKVNYFPLRSVHTSHSKHKAFKYVLKIYLGFDSCMNYCIMHKLLWYQNDWRPAYSICHGCRPPPPHSNRTRGYLCSFPITWTLLSQEKDIPPISGIGYHWQLHKNPPFPGFLGKSSRDYGQKYPPFPRKWEYACSPLMHSRGGGGDVDRSLIL